MINKQLRSLWTPSVKPATTLSFYLIRLFFFFSSLEKFKQEFFVKILERCQEKYKFQVLISFSPLMNFLHFFRPKFYLLYLVQCSTGIQGSSINILERSGLFPPFLFSSSLVYFHDLLKNLILQFPWEKKSIRHRTWGISLCNDSETPISLFVYCVFYYFSILLISYFGSPLTSLRDNLVVTVQNTEGNNETTVTGNCMIIIHLGTLILLSSPLN